jgi:hypothetical protein
MRFLSHSRRHGRHRKNPHRSHGRYRRNPAALKAIMRPANALPIVAVTGGFIGGAKLGAMVYDKLPAQGRRFYGILGFGLGSFLAIAMKKDIIKKLGVGVAVSGVHDLIAHNVPALLKGETINMSGRGVDLVGDDPAQSDEGMEGDVIDVDGDMTELVGDTGGDSIYA